MKTTCFVNYHATWGGAERVALEVCEALKEIGDVSVVSSAPGEFTRRFEGRNVVTFQPVSGGFSTPSEKLAAVFRFGLWLRKHVREQGFDIVYLNNQIGVFLSVFLLGLKCRKIAHDHTFQRSFLRKMAYNAVVRIGLDRIIFVSNALRRGNVVGRLAKARTIYNGFCFAPVQAQTAASERVIAMSAMMRHWKGHETLLDALALMHRQGHAVKCILIGGASSPEEESYLGHLKQKAERLGLAGQVEFLGYVPDVLALLAGYDALLVQPSSLPDPLPTTLIEGCFLGLPLVGSNIGGIPEIIVQGENGELVEPDDPARLAQGLQKVLGQSASQWQRMQDQARKMYSSRFSASVFHAAIIRELQECSSSS